MSVPLCVSFSVLHECLTHVHASDEMGCLPPRRVHHRTSRRFPLVLPLVLSLRLQPEPGVCACLRPRALGRLLSASPALRTWGLSALSPAASCVRVACRWALRPTLSCCGHPSARTPALPQARRLEVPGVSPSASTPAALMLCCLCAPRREAGSGLSLTTGSVFVPYLCFRKG